MVMLNPSWKELYTKNKLFISLKQKKNKIYNNETMNLLVVVYNKPKFWLQELQYAENKLETLV